MQRGLVEFLLSLSNHRNIMFLLVIRLPVWHCYPLIFHALLTIRSTCATTESDNAFKLYPPSNAEIILPPAVSAAISITTSVKLANPSAVRLIVAKGSRWCASNPAEIMTNSGEKLSSAGLSVFLNTSIYALVSLPGGIGAFSVVPIASPDPVSLAAPVPGYSGD